MELVAASDAPVTGNGRKRKTAPSVVETGTVSQSMRNIRKKETAGK